MEHTHSRETFSSLSPFQLQSTHLTMSIVEKFVTMDYGPAPEDPREALAWLDRHKRGFGHFIHGAWHPPIASKYFDTTDPSTGEKLAEVSQGSPADINAAVKSARAALPAWQSLTPHARARYLYALARQIQKHSRRLAVLETLDNGKPIRESRDIDIPLVARHFYHHAGWAQLLSQEFPGYEACGVVGQIIPVEFSSPHACMENRSRPGHGKHRRPEARRIYPAHRSSLRRNLPGNRSPPRASSTSSPATARLAKPSSPTPTSTKSPSPAPPKSAAPFAKPPPPATKNSLSSSAANPPSSFSKTPTSTPPSKASSTASGSTRAKSAAPDPAS